MMGLPSLSLDSILPIRQQSVVQGTTTPFSWRVQLMNQLKYHSFTQ